MTPRPHLLRLRFDVAGLEPSVTRIVEVPSTLRVIDLHDLIQSLFAWSGSLGHRFTDRPSATGGRRRVWEMDHSCRDRAPDHTSECEWTASVGDVFSVLEATEGFGRSTGGTLYYEYGRLDECPDDRRDRYDDGRWGTDPAWDGDTDPAWDGDTDLMWQRDADDRRCVARALGVVDEHLHGWLVAITVEERTRLLAQRGVGARIVVGRGRSPIEECQGAAGYTALLAVLADTGHPLHTRSDAWTRRLVGPWAASGTRPLDPDAFDPTVAQLALEWRPTYAWNAPRSAVDRALGSQHHQSSDRVERLAAVLHAMGDDADLPSADDANQLTAALRESLAALPSSRGKPPATVGADVPPEHDAWLRGGRLAYRRNRVLVRSRSGDAALEDPLDLLRRIAVTYWSIGSSGELALYVAMAAAEGLGDDELRAWVSAAARNADLELDDVGPWCSFLDRCGGLASGALDANMVRAFARLVLRT